MSATAVGAREVVQAWGRILAGYRPNLSIEITKECPLRCPGCYAYGDEHLGGNVTLRGVQDLPNDSQFQGLKDLTGSAILAPNFGITFRGTFGTVAGTIIGSEMNQKRVLVKFRRPPHGGLCADDLFDVAHDIAALGVQRVAIPRKGKPSKARRAHEHARPFRRLVKWRTGSEGRIACLKRRYGWRRSRLRGHEGAKIWCGYGVFAHNLGKIGALTA